MKRIAFICNTSWGVYKFRKSVIEALIKLNYNVFVITPPDGYESKLVELGVTYIPVQMNPKTVDPFKDILYLVRLIRLYRKHKFDLIFHFTIKPCIYGSIAAKLVRIKSIAFVTGLGYSFINKGIIHIIVKWLYRIALKYPYKVWLLNDDDIKLFVKEKIVIENKIQKINSEGIDLNFFKSNKVIANKDVVFLFIGRILIDKGIVEFIEAAKIVNNVFRNVEFKIIGQLSSNNPKAINKVDLDTYIKNSNIMYYGEIQDIRPFIENSTCFVLPSYREGVPVTNLEAMAMGRPIITTDVPGCRETVEDGKNGFFVPPKDAKALADAMIKFIELPYEKKLAMGKYSRAKAEKEFDEKIVIGQYLQILKTISAMTNV